jgi:SAM-dependent methyltransferase
VPSERDSTIRDSYDRVAGAYVEHLYDELARKPLDRHLLNRFAEEVRDRGLVADVGCGPGHVAGYLHEKGVQVIGIDLSPAMIRHALSLAPGIDYRTGDMRALELPDASLTGIVAFYSIVHLSDDEVATAFREFVRVLQPGGALIVAFHVGDDVVHRDEMWGQSVTLDFRFFRSEFVRAQLEQAGLRVTETTEREPYEGAEHASRRCYMFARKP